MVLITPQIDNKAQPVEDSFEEITNFEHYRTTEKVSAKIGKVIKNAIPKDKPGFFKEGEKITYTSAKGVTFKDTEVLGYSESGNLMIKIINEKGRAIETYVPPNKIMERVGIQNLPKVKETIPKQKMPPKYHIEGIGSFISLDHFEKGIETYTKVDKIIIPELSSQKLAKELEDWKKLQRNPKNLVFKNQLFGDFFTRIKNLQEMRNLTKWSPDILLNRLEKVCIKYIDIYVSKLEKIVPKDQEYVSEEAETGKAYHIDKEMAEKLLNNYDKQEQSEKCLIEEIIKNFFYKMPKILIEKGDLDFISFENITNPYLYPHNKKVDKVAFINLLKYLHKTWPKVFRPVPNTASYIVSQPWSQPKKDRNFSWNAGYANAT